MVFKAVAGNGENIYDTYKSDETSAEFVEEALDVTNSYGGHYKNRILLGSNWGSFNPDKVNGAQV